MSDEILVKDFPHLSEDFDVFRPTNHRANHNVCEFRVLKGTKLTGVQKDFFAKQCLKQFDGQPDIIGELSGIQFKKRYSIPGGTVDEWIKRVKCGLSNIDGGAGRRTVLDEQGMKDAMLVISQGVPEKVGGKKHKMRLMEDREVNKVFIEQAMKTAQRRGRVVDPDYMTKEDGEIFEVCPKVLKSLKKVIQHPSQLYNTYPIFLHVICF